MLELDGKEVCKVVYIPTNDNAAIEAHTAKLEKLEKDGLVERYSVNSLLRKNPHTIPGNANSTHVCIVAFEPENKQGDKNRYH